MSTAYEVVWIGKIGINIVQEIRKIYVSEGTIKIPLLNYAYIKIKHLEDYRTVSVRMRVS